MNYEDLIIYGEQLNVIYLKISPTDNFRILQILASDHLYGSEW
jgi:hypothetical protein